jgi:cysteine desulfurase
MSNAVHPVARQVLRRCARPGLSSRIAHFQNLSPQQRCYVSQTKPTNATVNLDSAIKAEQKAFVKNTGTRPEDVTLPGSGVSADAAMSPAAGELLFATCK